VIFNFCPTWAEVGVLTSDQLGWKLFLSPTTGREVGFENSVQLGQNYFLHFFFEVVLKMPFSSATIWREIF
jgi:hypothetical protein